ncbi:response regulator [Sphingomonas sp. AR_OL41]|uniref:ATP-binding protein n=1 Tax=Sphingomonas sp. AR_OL41 TaxID=3042729 RepID=UPI0024800AD2|nr:ATP-binding protein [Sphingomonas sp. AR_OL41]MDH7975835.1 response regulator [Sphingomonas sp. AR_OL41]
MEDRILLLALRGRDAMVMAQLLERQGHKSMACASAVMLADELARGVGAALITEESLIDADQRPLRAWLDRQEPWSDFPFIMLATKRAGQRSREAMETLRNLGNVVVLERPIHSETLASAVNAALRVRRRQYDARSRLVALETAEERLTQLNATLEARITERTHELSRANNQLQQEVNERERAQAALVQSQKMEAVGQLTGGIAHDFNNLLTVVSGNLDLIDRVATDERVKRYAGLAGLAATRASKLTHQLLAFSRTQQLTLTAVDLNMLVANMNDLLERTIGPQVAQRRLLDPRAPIVAADAHQLELAVLNLAINARDAMPEGGTLTIETMAGKDLPEGLTPGRYGVIRVSDTGMGIAPQLMARVFDPFFTTKPVGKGTGLGLSQVFGITRQSGGTVQIESAEGSGTSVSIWLPVAAAAGLPERPAAGAALLAPAGDGRALVIDDDDAVRCFIAECLEMFGYTVRVASSGAEGIALFEEDRPDLLVVDFAMPGMNGLAVATAARAAAPALPIILATGYADSEVADPNPVTTVLRKPFRIDDLSQAVRTALDTVKETVSA